MHEQYMPMLTCLQAGGRRPGLLELWLAANSVVVAASTATYPLDVLRKRLVADVETHGARCAACKLSSIDACQGIDWSMHRTLQNANSHCLRRQFVPVLYMYKEGLGAAGLYSSAGHMFAGQDRCL